MPAPTEDCGPLTVGKVPLSVAPASRSRSWPSRYALSLLRYSRSNARRSSTRRSSSSRCCTREPMACRCRSWASRSRLSALALASLVICSAWRRALPRISSASRRARPRVSSASRRASAIAWSAVCCASASTRAAVSMLSSGGGAILYSELIMAGSGRRRSGSGIIGSGAIRSGSWSVSGELSADTAVLPPRMHSASFARSSSFSWMSRSSSTSTSSRKASTSSSSYPGLSLVVLNCLFRTSAGVSGISSPRRAWCVPLWDRTGSEQLYGVDQEKNNEEQQHEAEVEGNTADPEHGDEPAQELQRRIGGRIDGFRRHQDRAPRLPVAGKRLYPAENQPPEQEEQIKPQCIGQHDLYDGHCSALSRQPMAGRPLRGRHVLSFVTGCLTLVEEPSFRHPSLVLGRDLDVRR